MAIETFCGHLARMREAYRGDVGSVVFSCFSGFFVYPIPGSKKCETVIAPHVGRVAHEAHLAVATEAITWLDDSIIRHETHDGLTLINLDGLEVSQSDKSLGADIITGQGDDVDFSMVPDVQHMYCGIQLSKFIEGTSSARFKVRLAEGMLGAAPGEKTYKEKWQWTTCDGKPHEQRVTSDTLHLSGSPSQLVLSFATLNGQLRGRAVLRPLPLPFLDIPLHFLVFANTPPKGAVARDVELGHIQSIEQMVDTVGPTFSIPAKTRLDTPLTSSRAERPEGPLLALLEHAILASARFNGTPECSGQQGSI